MPGVSTECTGWDGGGHWRCVVMMGWSTAAGIEETEACRSAEGLGADHRPRGVVDAHRERRLLIGGKRAAGVVSEGLDRGGRGRLQNSGGIRRHEKKRREVALYGGVGDRSVRRAGRKLSREKS